MFPQNLHTENLNLSVMVLEGGALGRCLGHEGGTLIEGISAFMKEASESSLIPSAMRGHSKNPSMIEEAGPHQILNLPVP